MLALSALAALALMSDPMTNIVGNTAEVTDAAGQTTSWMFKDDGTFTATNGATGSWRSQGTELCMTPNVPEGEPQEACLDMGEEVHEVGDKWSMTGLEGNLITVEIKAGQE